MSKLVKIFWNRLTIETIVHKNNYIQKMEEEKFSVTFEYDSETCETCEICEIIFYYSVIYESRDT